MEKYTLYWLDGRREIVEGGTLKLAMSRAGYGDGALMALDFYVKGEDHTYVYNEDRKTWVGADDVFANQRQVGEKT